MIQIPKNKNIIPSSKEKIIPIIVILSIISAITGLVISYFFINEKDANNSTTSYNFDNNYKVILESYSSIIDINNISSNSSYNEITVLDSLFINEIMADNDITIAGPDMNYPDWIELYNAGSESLNISGMYLTDDLTNPTKWQFPNGTTIDSDGYLLIWGDGYTGHEGLYASFKLNANGDSVALFDSDGKTLIDSVTYKKQIRDTSYGRVPDAGDNWEYLSHPSPGWTNGEKTSDNETSFWILPLLIFLIIIVLFTIITLRRTLIRRDYR